MSGNVWEWCNDLYASSIGISSSDVINPMNVRSGDYRTQRGGCWKDYELDAFVYNRRSDACGGGSSAFWDDWGFRLCRSLTNTESIDNTEYFGEEFFGGNSNVNVEEAFNSKQFYLRGNMNNWCNDALNDGALTKNEEGIYSIVYIANCMEDEFCIADSFWSMKFCGIDVSVGNDFVELIPYAGPNAKILNQVPGNSYKMIIEPLESTVRVKVELYEKNIPSFYLKNSNSETIEMVYDRTSYTYQFTALSESESFSFWSDNGFYCGDLVINNEEILSVCNGLTETTISGLIPNKNYDIILYVIDEKVNICVLQHCPYFIIGSFSYNGDNVWKKMTASNIDNVYIYEFTYVSSMSNNDWWSSPSNGISFVITNRNGSFDAVFNGVELTSDYVVSRGYGDALATNLLEGRTYIIYLKEENGLYFAKIEEK
jgi:hypothetical protein